MYPYENDNYISSSLHLPYDTSYLLRLKRSIRPTLQESTHLVPFIQRQQRLVMEHNRKQQQQITSKKEDHDMDSKPKQRKMETSKTSQTKLRGMLKSEFPLPKSPTKRSPPVDGVKDEYNAKTKRERKLVADVLDRYWKLKEKEASRAYGHMKDGEKAAVSKEKDWKLPAQPTNPRDERQTTPLSTYSRPYPRNVSQQDHVATKSDKYHSNEPLLHENHPKVTRTANPTAAINPGSPDVLFGRRQAQRTHPGNIRLRELCQEFQAEYRTGDRGQKTAITWRIVRMIQNEGGRFLKFDPDQKDWTEVENDMAREKVAFTIRDTFHQIPNQDL